MNEQQMFSSLISSTPVWIVVIVWFILTLYKDILKPYVDRKAKTEELKAQKELELEQKNNEIKKYNEEQARWNRLFKYMQDNKLDKFSLPTTRRYIVAIVTWSCFELIKKVMELFVSGSFIDIERKYIVEKLLFNFSKAEKERSENMLSGIFYNDIELNKVFTVVTEEHTKEFVNELIEKYLFVKNDKNNMKDAVEFIESHYREHSNEFMNYIKSQSKYDE